MSDEVSKQCASQLMDTVHLIMQAIGSDAKSHASADLSMQQFRALLGIQMGGSVSLSEVAEHLGSTISATSKMVDGLVERGLITRVTAPDDRRKVVITLTQQGNNTMESMHVASLSYVNERLSSLTNAECSMVMLAMDLIRSAFTQKPAN